MAATRSVPITWVDAFTDRAFAGNPAAVCTLESPLEETVMQSLANELGISETAFVSRAGDAWSLRWFTPTTEVDLCGHATLATAHVLREDGRIAGDEPVGFETRSGRLTASFDGSLIELDFPSDPPVPTALPDVLAALRDEVRECRRSSFFFVAVFDKESDVAAFVPDLGEISQLAESALLITAAGDADDTDYVLRVFGPKVGIDEDPATGSAQCVAGPYWAEQLKRESLTARQLSRRGAGFFVRVGQERVRIAGHAKTVLRGNVELPTE
jgi:PhzF family phenazine biosynthesis protein